MNCHWVNMLARFRNRHGDKFVPPKASDRQKEYFGTGQRVEVTTTYPSGETYVRRGTIGITTGWAPALLLMHRRGSMGSSDVLRADDQITAVIDSKGKRHALTPGS